MNVQKLNEIRRNFEIQQQQFLSKLKIKNYFCLPVLFWTDKFFKDMEKNFIFGGLIGYWNSCMDCFLQTPKFSD